MLRHVWRAINEVLRRADRRRGGTRLSLDQELHLAVGDQVVAGTARDLSAGGVFLETDAELPVDAQGALARAGGAGVPVRVVRATARGVGLAFRSGE